MAAAQTFEIARSTVRSASANSDSIKLTTATMMDVYLAITAVTGTSPQMAVWMQASRDKVTWFDLIYDLGLETTGTAADLAGQTGRRNINGTALAAAALTTWAGFKHVPALYVRAAWDITGTFAGGEGFTFSITASVK